MNKDQENKNKDKGILNYENDYGKDLHEKNLIEDKKYNSYILRGNKVDYNLYKYVIDLENNFNTLQLSFNSLINDLNYYRNRSNNLDSIIDSKLIEYNKTDLEKIREIINSVDNDRKAIREEIRDECNKEFMNNIKDILKVQDYLNGVLLTVIEYCKGNMIDDRFQTLFKNIIDANKQTLIDGGDENVNINRDML